MTAKTLLVLTEIPEGTVAIWERIADEIRRRIDSGLWAASQQLLAESELATELGVARGTLRRAIKDLCDSGHLVQRHGRGTFVAKRSANPMVNRLESLGERMARSGLNFQTVELSRALVPDGVEAGLDSVPAMVIRRLRSIDGAPVAVLSNAVPLDVFPGIGQRNLTERPLYTVMEEDYKVALVRAERTFKALPADQNLAPLLGLTVGEPVLYFQQLAWGSDDQILDIGETWIRSDRHQPTVSMWRHA